MIESIESIFVDDNRTVYVSAVVDGAVLTYAQTLYDPPEYGSALCEASFTLEDDEVLPEDESELLQFVERLDLSWNVVDNSDDYFD